MLLDTEKKKLSDMLEHHGCRGAVRALAHAMSDQSHELSDLGLKDQAREMAEWANLLSDLLVE